LTARDTVQETIEGLKQEPTIISKNLLVLMKLERIKVHFGIKVKLQTLRWGVTIDIAKHRVLVNETEVALHNAI
jgi:hypothetical protein